MNKTETQSVLDALKTCADEVRGVADLGIAREHQAGINDIVRKADAAIALCEASLARVVEPVDSLIAALKEYRCCEAVDDEGYGSHLVDVLTTHGKDIGPGLREIATLAEFLSDYATPQEDVDQPRNHDNAELIANLRHCAKHAPVSESVYFMKAANALEAVASAWIPIADRLPELNQSVALCHEDQYENTGGDWTRNLHAAGYLSDCGGPYWSIRGERACCLDAYTHWMPLPVVPGSAT